MKADVSMKKSIRKTLGSLLQTLGSCYMQVIGSVVGIGVSTFGGKHIYFTVGLILLHVILYRSVILSIS